MTELKGLTGTAGTRLVCADLGEEGIEGGKVVKIAIGLGGIAENLSRPKIGQVLKPLRTHLHCKRSFSQGKWKLMTILQRLDS